MLTTSAKVVVPSEKGSFMPDLPHANTCIGGLRREGREEREEGTHR